MSRYATSRFCFTFSVVLVAMLIAFLCCTTGCSKASDNSSDDKANTTSNVEVQQAERQDKNGFNPNTNQTLTISSFSFQVPSYFGDRTPDSTDTNTVYYANDEGGFVMLYASVTDYGSGADSFVSHGEDFAKGVAGAMEGFVLDDWSETTIAGAPGMRVNASGDYNGQSMTMHFAVALDEGEGKLVNLALAQGTETKNDYLPDFERIVSSATRVADETDQSSAKTEGSGDSVKEEAANPATTEQPSSNSGQSDAVEKEAPEDEEEEVQEKKVPNVVGKDLDKATTILEEDGFDNVEFKKEDGSSPWIFIQSNWAVKSQSPKAGEKVDPEDEVDLVVYKKDEENAKKEKQKKYKVGKQFKVDGWAVKINKVREATTLNQGFGMKYKASGKLVLVTLTVKNKSKKPDSFQDDYLTLVDSSENEYESTSDSYDMALCFDNYLSYSERLNPGQKKKVVIAFDVPKKLKKYDLRITNGWFGDSKMVKLK